MLKIAAAVCKQIMAAWRRVGTVVGFWMRLEGRAQGIC